MTTQDTIKRLSNELTESQNAARQASKRGDFAAAAIASARVLEIETALAPLRDVAVDKEIEQLKAAVEKAESAWRAVELQLNEVTKAREQKAAELAAFVDAQIAPFNRAINGVVEQRGPARQAVTTAKNALELAQRKRQQAQPAQAASGLIRR
jgi:hypothetical protein